MCLHAVPAPGPIVRGSMSLALFKKIAREVFPHTHHLSLSCTAEPLLSDMFLQILKLIGKYNLPLVDFVTNATLLNRKTADVIISSGIDFMLVSVDSADKEVFKRIRKGANLEKVIKNIEGFQEMKRERGLTKPAIRFSSVLMRSTIEGIEDLMWLAHRLGAEGIVFRHLIPYVPLQLRDETLFDCKKSANKYISKAKALAKELNFKIFSIPDEFTDGKPEQDAAKPACGLPTTILIKPNGNIVPCEADLLGLVMGNLAKQSFDEIWNSPAYRKLRDDLSSGNYREACKKCPAIVSNRFSDSTAFQEIAQPVFREVISMFLSQTPFSREAAYLCNRSMAKYNIIKPEYDLLTDSGEVEEKIERWKEWYEATTKRIDAFNNSS